MQYFQSAKKYLWLISLSTLVLTLPKLSVLAQSSSCQHGQDCKQECAERVMGICIKPRLRCKCIEPPSLPQTNRGSGYVLLSLPTNIPPQDDLWSCGPNSAARVLGYYGHSVTYNTLRLISIRIQNIPEGQRMGIAPHELRNIMQRYEGNKVVLERSSNITRLLNLLVESKPVITLLRVGSFRPAGCSRSYYPFDFGYCNVWPEMHWVVVTGFNSHNNQIYYTDTNGGKYLMTYHQFNGQWNWGIGDGLAKEVMYANGVYPRTMVWVDRQRQPNQLNNNLSPGSLSPGPFAPSQPPSNGSFGTPASEFPPQQVTPRPQPPSW